MSRLSTRDICAIKMFAQNAGGMSKADCAKYAGISYSRFQTVLKREDGKRILARYAGEVLAELKPAIMQKLHKWMDDENPMVSMKAIDTLLKMLKDVDEKAEDSVVVEFPNMQPPLPKVPVYYLDSGDTGEYVPEQYVPEGSGLSEDEIDNIIASYEDTLIVPDEQKVDAVYGDEFSYTESDLIGVLPYGKLNAEGSVE